MNNNYNQNMGYNPNFQPNLGYGNVNNIPNFNNFDFEKFNQQMEIQKEKDNLKKTSNRVAIGLVLFEVIITVLTIVFIIPLFFTGAIDLSGYSLDSPMESSMSIIEPVTMYLLNGVLCLVGFLIAGIIIIKSNKLRLDDVILIKRTNFIDTVKIVIAGMGFVFVFNILLVLMNLNLSIFGFKNEMPDYGTVEGLLGSILYFISVAVVPPIIEEFIFRGAILGTIRKLHGDVIAIIVSSVLFGFAHANFVQTPVTFLTGLVLGFITVKTGSMVPAMFLHFVNNSIAVLSEIAMNSIENDTVFNVIDILITAIFLIIGFVFAVSIIKKYKNTLFTFDRPNSKLSLSQQLITVFTAPWMIIFTLITISSCIASASLM